jgi:hypothetical protein
MSAANIRRSRLVNDVPGDNTPYILTARHCETGQLGGGNPGAASTVTVHWDATSTCGATLGSLYDGNTISTPRCSRRPGCCGGSGGLRRAADGATHRDDEEGTRRVLQKLGRPLSGKG